MFTPWHSVKPNMEEGEESRYSLGNVQCLLVLCPSFASSANSGIIPLMLSSQAFTQNGQSRGSGTLTCGSARLYWICSNDASQSLSVEWPTIIMSAFGATRCLSSPIFRRCVAYLHPRSHVTPDCRAQARGIPRSILLLHCVPFGYQVRPRAPLHQLSLACAQFLLSRCSYEHREGQDSGDETAAGAHLVLVCNPRALPPASLCLLQRRRSFDSYLLLQVASFSCGDWLHSFNCFLTSSDLLGVMFEAFSESVSPRP